MARLIALILIGVLMAGQASAKDIAKALAGDRQNVPGAPEAPLDPRAKNSTLNGVFPYQNMPQWTLPNDLHYIDQRDLSPQPDPKAPKREKRPIG